MRRPNVPWLKSPDQTSLSITAEDDNNNNDDRTSSAMRAACKSAKSASDFSLLVKATLHSSAAPELGRCVTSHQGKSFSNSFLQNTKQCKHIGVCKLVCSHVRG
jgi:hypothetical protein